MTFHMPPLRVSENTISGNTASREYGQKKPGEPNFRGDTWVIRDEYGRLVDDFHKWELVERFYPGTVPVEFFKE